MVTRTSAGVPSMPPDPSSIGSAGSTLPPGPTTTATAAVALPSPPVGSWIPASTHRAAAEQDASRKTRLVPAAADCAQLADGPAAVPAGRGARLAVHVPAASVTTNGDRLEPSAASAEPIATQVESSEQPAPSSRLIPACAEGIGDQVWRPTRSVVALEDPATWVPCR